MEKHIFLKACQILYRSFLTSHQHDMSLCTFGVLQIDYEPDHAKYRTSLLANPKRKHPQSNLRPTK
jgi:hypothetical protein